MKSRRTRPATHIPRRKAMIPPELDSWQQDTVDDDGTDDAPTAGQRDREASETSR